MKYLIILLFLFCFGNCYAEEIDIGKIIQIESGGYSQAYNEKSGAIGLMQITPICLEEWNNNDALQYDPKHLYRPHINKLIGNWYINTRIPQLLKAYGIKDTVTNRIIAYSWGISNLRKYLKGEKKLPKSVKAYLRKYKEK